MTEKVTAFFCRPKADMGTCQAVGCGATATARCDWQLSGSKAGLTCSRRMCQRHRHQQGGGFDYCRVHVAMDRARIRGAR